MFIECSEVSEDMKKQTRYSIVVIVVAALLLQVNSALEHFTIRRSFNEQLTEMAQRDLNESHRIDRIKREVEKVMKETMPVFESHVNNLDSLRSIMKEICRHQDQIVGVSLAYVPGTNLGEEIKQIQAKQEGRYGIYIYLPQEDDDATVHSVEFKEQSIDFDYTKRSWFDSIAGKGKTNGDDGFWTEPYDGNYNYILMCSYSLPVYDAEGNVIAALAADVPLRELSQMATKFYHNQRKAALLSYVLQILGLILLMVIIVRTFRNIKRLQTLDAEKRRISSELSVAHDIQQSMIPKAFIGSPERDDVEVYASLSSVREVGGDFYDFLIRDNHLFFCIGDVSGKGVPAALLMTVSRTLFRTEAEREFDDAVERKGKHSATAVVQRMNRTLSNEHSNGYFVTMFVGVLDLLTGDLDYCNAGHEAPVLGDTLLPVIPNLPVGALPDWVYEGQTGQIKPDQTLFLYTDGLSEARDTQDRQFSRRKVLELVSQSSDLSPQDLVKKMVEEADRHAKDAVQSDDITMMAVKWKKIRNMITLQGDGSDLERMKSFILLNADKAGMNKKDAKRLRLIVEEAVANVVNYSGTPSLLLAAEVVDRQLHITVTDSGKPFNPITAPVTDISVSGDERKEGGLGILFMRQMSDGLDYRRENEHNILTIKKNIL